MTLSQKITLNEAVRQTTFWPQAVNLWVTEENVLKDKIPPQYTFKSIKVLWGTVYPGFTVIVDLHNPLFNCPKRMYLNKKQGQFSSLKTLQEYYPKLFTATGEFEDALAS